MSRPHSKHRHRPPWLQGKQDRDFGERAWRQCFKDANELFSTATYQSSFVKEKGKCTDLQKLLNAGCKLTLIPVDLWARMIVTKFGVLGHVFLTAGQQGLHTHSKYVYNWKTLSTWQNLQVALWGMQGRLFCRTGQESSGATSPEYIKSNSVHMGDLQNLQDAG